MLNSLGNFLWWLGSADYGVECVLNKGAYESLICLIKDAYGENTAEVVRGFFIERDSKWICVSEDVEDAFRLCLTGKG